MLEMVVPKISVQLERVIDTRDGLKLTIQSVQLERKKKSTEVRRFGGLFD